MISSNRIMHLLINLNRDEQDDLIAEIIDKAIRIAWNRNQFSNSDFTLIKGEYRLKYEKNYDYCSVFFNALIPYKKEIFKYIQSYYKCFMGKKSILCYPLFKI